MSEAADVADGDDGVYMAGARYVLASGTEVAAIGQQTPDVFNTLFAKVENRFALADDRSLRAILQFGLLVDVQLGGMSAIKMHGKLSEQGDRTPVAYLTAFDDRLAQSQALAIGCAGYFRKTDIGQETLATARRVTSSPYGAPAPAVLGSMMYGGVRRLGVDRSGYDQPGHSPVVGSGGRHVAAGRLAPGHLDRQPSFARRPHVCMYHACVRRHRRSRTVGNACHNAAGVGTRGPVEPRSDLFRLRRDRCLRDPSPRHRSGMAWLVGDRRS